MVTRKITQHVAQWAISPPTPFLHLGNLDARRDWGLASEYVEAMHVMLQQPKPDDYVIGTGVTCSVRDFAEKAIVAAGLSLEKYGPLVVGNTASFTRQNELNSLCADATKAKTVLHWAPSCTVDELAKIMVEHDIEEEEKRIHLGREHAVGAV